MSSPPHHLKDAVLDGLYLFSNSEGHRHYTISEFLSYLVYPVIHQKARFYYENGKAVGLATWCFLSDEKSQAFLNDDYVLQEEDYLANEGDQLWCIELIAPHGHIWQILRDLRAHNKKLYGVTRKAHWRRFKNRNSIHKGVFR